MNSNPLLSPAEAEISLLDWLLTVSQNIKLLILGPLAAGLCALGVTFALPPTYESVAILTTDTAGINLTSILRQPSMLDPVVVSQGLANGKTVEQARLALDGRIKTMAGKQDKLLTISVSGESPQQAQAAHDFLRMQELMLRSVTLSGEESDRLLRYQTTWERRLSSAIGELLVLQAKNTK